jgi:hypothetical protein
MKKFRLAHGLTRYKEDQDTSVLPYFKDEWLTAAVIEAPQADNPEFGLQLIYDWVYEENRLKIEENVRESFEKEGVLPVTKDMVKTGVPPVLKALGFVLGVYFQRPFQKGGGMRFTNWDAKIKDKKSEEGFREVYVA